MAGAGMLPLTISQNSNQPLADQIVAGVNRPGPRRMVGPVAWGLPWEPTISVASGREMAIFRFRSG